MKGILGNQISGIMQNRKRSRSSGKGRPSKSMTNRGLMPEIKEDPDKEEMTDDEMLSNSPKTKPVLKPEYATTD